MSLAGDVVREYRALSPDRLLRFHERWLRATFQPGIEVSALSCPRGNAKSATVGRLLAVAMTPESPLWRPGLETVVVAASLKQARITWRFMRALLGDDDAYRWQDSDQRIACTHVPSGQAAYCISSSGKAAMGLSQFGAIIFDEPAALDLRNGALLFDAVRQSLGKVEGQRLLLIGTRAPADPGTWWPDLLDAGSSPGQHVTLLSAPSSEPWDAWATIRRVNPVANVHAPLRGTILRERDEARRNPTLRRSFEAYRLNRQVETVDEMLCEADDWLSVERRPVPEREGRPIVGIDMGGSRSWSAAWCLWANGRSECFAVCPGIPDLGERERMDAMPAGAYSRLLRDGVLHIEDAKQVADPATLVAVLAEHGIRPVRALCDRFMHPQLVDAVAGRFRIEPRQTRWSEATEDIAAFRQLVADGPLSIAAECRGLARIALGQAVVVSDDQGSTRLSKKRHSRSRDDVAVCAVLAAGQLAREMRKPKPRARRHWVVA